MSRRADNRGFTLVELLVTMLIGMIGLGSVLSALEVLLRQSHASRQQAEAQDQARTAGDRLAVGLRNALASPGVAPSAVERADPFDLVFQTIDPFTTPGAGNALGAMRVRYCLDATDPSRGVLRVQSQRWTASPTPAIPAPGGCTAALNGWQDNRVVATDLVNRSRTPALPVWSYTPGTFTSLAAIQAVGMNLVVDREPANVRGARAVTSAVSLRNANRAPVVDFTYSRAGGYVVLNGSASFDPDGDTLTYEWFIDNAPQAGETGRQFKRAGLTPRTYQFRLDVRDSSGLVGTKTRTVLIS